MNGAELERRVEAVRRFNRFYTQKIGVLNRGYLNSRFTLTEARVLYELAHNEPTTAARLGRELGLDPGYLSRILRGFREHGLIERQRSDADGREQMISLTEAGREAFGRLDAAARGEIEAMLTRLSAEEQDRLVRAMGTIESLLGGAPERRVSYILRPHQPGDLGWIVYRHGVLYNQEYRWDERFEALVAQVVADFVWNFDPRRERCWIAEMNGEPVGSVFLVKHPEREGVAKLRLLLVEPRARGLGIGRRLVQECTRFARQAGYRKITLWTNNVLVAARRIYEQEGYRLVHQEPYEELGEGWIGETWELDL